MNPTTHLNYSPEDLATYSLMVREQMNLLERGKTIFDAPDLWQRFENLRNKYNGNPPLQLHGQTREKRSPFVA